MALLGAAQDASLAHPNSMAGMMEAEEVLGMAAGMVELDHPRVMGVEEAMQQCCRKYGDCRAQEQQKSSPH